MMSRNDVNQLPVVSNGHIAGALAGKPAQFPADPRPNYKPQRKVSRGRRPRHLTLLDSLYYNRTKTLSLRYRLASGVC